MEDFKGGKFIVGSDIRTDEQRRLANEYMRSQNESQRINAENSRNNATTNALGIANVHSKSNFLTQIGLFSAVVLTIIILAVIAILAYEKAYNNQSLVDLNNIRDLTLTNLDVLNTADIKTLDVTGETTAVNITTTGDITVGDDLVVTGGLSVNGESIFYDLIKPRVGVSILKGGLSVGGITNLYGNLVSNSGISTTGGLSVGGITNLYGNLVSNSGISTTGGLSVGSVANFYSVVKPRAGVSILSGGLSVSGITNLYGNLVSDSGISTTSGLSVGGTARIEILKPKREYTILTKNLTNQGISGGTSLGYQLTVEDAGTTFIIQNEDSEGDSIRNVFLLPEVTDTNNGLTYDFLWGNNQSALKRSFELMIKDPSLDESLAGIVLAGQNGTSVITMTLTGDGNAPLGYEIGASPTLFHYEGKVYAGSKLTCTYVSNNWQLYGSLGVNSDHISDNGFVSTNNLPWLIAGTSDSGIYTRKYIVSNTGNHFYNAVNNINTYINNTDITSIEYGISGDGTSVWNFGLAYNTILYSLDGVSFFTSDDVTPAYSKITYGLSQGVSVWSATGWYTNNSPTNSLYYSNNGINWQPGTGASFGQTTDAYGFGIAYGLSSDGTSMRVAVGTDGYGNGIKTKSLLYSSDGISWQDTTGASFSGGVGYGVAYGLSDDYTTGIWAAVGQVSSGTSSLLYSLNGVNWSYSTGANFNKGDQSENYLGAIAYGLSSNGTSGIWVATTANSDSASTTNILYSLDGMSWRYSTGANFGANGSGADVKYGQDNLGNGLWLATGNHISDNDSNILKSTDGMVWSALTTGVDLVGGEQGRSIGFNKLSFPNPGNVVGL